MMADSQAGGKQRHKRSRNDFRPWSVPMRCLAGGLALALLFAAWHALQGVRTGLVLWQADRYMERWSDAGTLPPDAEYQRVVTALESALQRHPDNPDLHERLGQTLEWMANYTTDAAVGRDALPRALQHFRHVAALRPVWPFGWNRVAALNFHLQQTGDEFALAIRNAVLFGPQERFIQWTVAYTGLDAWATLDDRTQKSVLLMTEALAGHNKADALDALRSSPSAGRICALPGLSPGMAALCADIADIAAVPATSTSPAAPQTPSAAVPSATVSSPGTGRPDAQKRLPASASGSIKNA